MIVTATAPETAERAAFEQSIMIIVGDSATAVQKHGDPIIPTKARVAFGVQFGKDGLMLNTPVSGTATVEIFSTLGQKAVADLQATVNAGANWIPLNGLKSGSYVVRISQGSMTQRFGWNKK